MPLSPVQRNICRLIAESRKAAGESYVAGGAALNEWLGAGRLSRDLDLFHDSEDALRASWDSDRVLLETHGFSVEPLRERASFVEARVSRGAENTVLEWAQDSAFRFFPLVEHPELGLTLHPFDLATNKTLAMVGRLEVRDWVDLMAAAEGIQPLGYLAWAACGKDPGFSPKMLLNEASRAHYSAAEVAGLTYDGPTPDAAELSRSWKSMLIEAKTVVELLPLAHVGCCVMNAAGTLATLAPEELEASIAAKGLIFHWGSIRGALPTITG